MRQASKVDGLFSIQPASSLKIDSITKHENPLLA